MRSLPVWRKPRLHWFFVRCLARHDECHHRRLLPIDTHWQQSNGYFQLGYGDFINGYNIKSGFSLGTLATTEGVTLTPITAYNGNVGTYHVTVHLFPQAADSDGKHPTFGDGAGGTASSYYQFSLGGTGWYGGTATFSVDNVQIGAVSVSEPASIGVVALAASASLRRRNRA